MIEFVIVNKFLFKKLVNLKMLDDLKGKIVVLIFGMFNLK